MKSNDTMYKMGIWTRKAIMYLILAAFAMIFLLPMFFILMGSFKAESELGTWKMRKKQKSQMKMREARNGLLFVMPWIIGFLVFTLYPILMSLYYSFCNYNVISAPTFIGLGNYIQEIKRIYSSVLEIAGVADLDMVRVRQTAEKFEIPGAFTVEEMLENPEIELIVNLTPPMVHTTMSRRILEAGKHVFCEKPFALTVGEAQEIADLAKEKGLYAGSAPDTFLTAPMQSCRKLLEDGWIGKPLYVTANMMSCGVETWHPAPKAFYSKGGGPLYDMAGYYLSVLIHFFGPVQEVFSYGVKGFEERRIYSQPLAGSTVKVEVPTHYTSVLKMANGVLVNMNMSFDIWHSTLPKLEIYGTEGTMTLPDPNMSYGKASVRSGTFTQRDPADAF